MTRRARSVLLRTDGFTMAAVMMGMLVLMSLSVAAFGAANGDIRLGQRSVDEKKAYAAAEAGIAYYLQKLAQDNDHWTRCTNGPPADETNPINLMWNGTGGDPRAWRKLPTSPEQQYAIELLPRPGRAACVPGDNESMIDPGQGTLRIRATGRSRGVYRSVVSTLRRNGFLDFIYFTDRETSDPAQQSLAYPSSIWANVELKRMAPAQARIDLNANDSIEAWADSVTNRQPTCGQWHRGVDADRRGRSSSQGAYPGSARFDPDGANPYGWYSTTYFGAATNIQCSLIQFRGPDKVDGPFHSNDHICVTNDPSFGRPGKNDRIEFFGYRTDGGCESDATMNSTPKTGADLVTLGMPRSNSSLRATTFAPYRFTGKTQIELLNDKLRVTRADGTVSTLSWPANGLVYVANGGTPTCPKWDIRRPYGTTVGGDNGCGDALVSGTYSKSLTVNTERDVIVTGDIKAASGSDALLGLISQNYVRVKHTAESYPCNKDTPDLPGPPQNRTIEAAILSLNHVFTVDNYQCGDPLGNLTVFGAIAQRYRGPVGTSSGGTAVTGYTKVYKYDDRLRFRSPPYFITPVESAWRVMRTSEQSAATRPAL